MFQAILSVLSRFVGLFLRAGGANSFPPPLSKEREKELFLKARGGDLSARNTLIEHNLRLVAHIVKKYYLSYREQDDLISVGTVGLIKAIDSFYKNAEDVYDFRNNVQLLVSWYIQEIYLPAHKEEIPQFDPLDKNQVDLSGLPNAGGN